MRAIWLVAIGLVVACGGGGDDGDDGDDGETGVCRDKPCLTSIDDEADWAIVSVPHAGNRCDFVEETKYLAPATATAALQDVVFQDAAAHRFHLEFMTQVLPEFFGGLTPQMYQALVQRRATRQYWAGALYRLTDPGGATIGYGFDVIFDPADWNEQLTEQEVVAVATALEARFHLPLVYAPTDNEAIFSAASFTMVETHMPRQCQHTTCPTAGVDCVVVPTAIDLCGHFVEGRTVQAEHAMKAQLAVNAGTYDLPRGLGMHEVPAIFGAGVLGPTRAPITPSGGGRYEVTELGGYLYRTYEQSFSTGGRTLELTWDLWLAEGGGGYLLAEPWAGDMMAYADLVPQQSFDERLHLSSCIAANLEHWQINGTMAGGDGFTVDFRYRYPFAGSGPLFATRGRVTLGGQTATVGDYFSLVYAGEHHNWNNQYWVLFASPLTYAGHPVHGLWIDEQPYQFELEAAHTLDAALQPLDLLTVDSYEVAPVQ